MNYKKEVKNVLVAGGAGFVGSNLIRRLLESGSCVTCLDNLHTGNLKNISKFQKNKNFHFVEKDVNEILDIKIDEIYNLASPASPKHYQSDPIQTLKTNVIGTNNLLDLAKKNNSKFLQASTSEIYGNPKEHPQKETYWGNVNPIGVRSCYDEGKRCAETLCLDFKRKLKVDVRIIRIFNTYGPNMHPDDGRVVSNFIVQALQNKNITVYGDGKQTRSFSYIDDLLDGISFVMEDSTSNEKVFLTPFNIGNPKEFKILELAKRIIALTNSSSKIIFKKLPLDDPEKRKPDISRMKKKYGWSPNYDLEKGLIKTIEYFRDLI